MINRKDDSLPLGAQINPWAFCLGLALVIALGVLVVGMLAS